jgi:UDPglucose 6-dehydrogenase
MRLSVFGVGYVGLVQAAVFADGGHHVLCVDLDGAKIDKLNRGIVPIFEPGLERLVQEGIEAGLLNFTTSAEQGVGHGETIFIAVGTPPSEDGSADLSHVLAVADTLGGLLERDCTVVVKSTVPVGTCDKVAQRLRRQLELRGRQDLKIRVASNPEFLKEGSAVADCTKPDRIVIGVGETQTEDLLREIYAPFNRNHDKVIVMDVRSAELTKYAANCMLATKISFINEMANLAALVGADIERVRLGIGSDPRIGYQFIYPGIGYGGSCFPKDVRAMIRTATQLGYEPALLHSVEARNNAQKQVLCDKVTEVFGDDLRGRTFGLWGLAFKPNTDDMRDAPSRTIMETLWARGARIRAHDPKAMAECRRIYGTRDDIDYCGAPLDALQGSDALIVATEWKAYAAPDFPAIRAALVHPLIFDGRNMYDPAVARRYGVGVIGIGRGDTRRAIADFALNAIGRAIVA